nr:probable serine/threonine-protein kinase DDB_G0282963 isoform X1 [Ipomoea batatas]
MLRLCRCALQRRAGGQVRVLRCGEWWIGSRVWSSSVAGSHYLAHFTWDFRAIWVPLILLWLLGFIDFPLSVQMRGLDWVGCNHEGDMNGILSLWSGALVSVFKCVPTAVDYGVKKLCKNNNVGGVDQQLPSFNLPEKFLCRVVNVRLQIIAKASVLIASILTNLIPFFREIVLWTSWCKEYKIQLIGDHVFSSCSNGSAMSNVLVKVETEEHDTGDLKANLSGYSESANGSIDLFTLSNGSIDLFATGTSKITHENEVESNNNPKVCREIEEGSRHAARCLHRWNIERDAAGFSLIFHLLPPLPPEKNREEERRNAAAWSPSSPSTASRDASSAIHHRDLAKFATLRRQNHRKGRSPYSACQRGRTERTSPRN